MVQPGEQGTLAEHFPHGAEREHHVVRWTEYDEGGHFFAMERPSAFVDDVRAFLRGLG